MAFISIPGDPSITSRLYQGEQDLLRIQAMLMEARAHSDDWRYAHIGEMMFSYFMVACHLNLHEFIRLWFAEDTLVGYAILGEDPSIDWQIMPAYEWRGIEQQVLEWVKISLADLRRREFSSWSTSLVSGARQDNPRRIAFLEQNGFIPGSQFSEVNMIRSLADPISEPVAPPGFLIQSMADMDDISIRAAAQREVWQPWTVGNVSEANYRYLMQLPGYQVDLDVVAIAPDQTVAAYVNGWLDPVNQVGDFGPVGTRLAYRRQGLARAVLIDCLHRMRARGMQRVTVSTGVSNKPAIQLYESVGFRIVNRYLEYVTAWCA